MAHREHFEDCVERRPVETWGRFRGIVALVDRLDIGEFLLGLNRAVRQEAGVEAGDTVEVKLELDTAPREVEVPVALANALAEDSQARAAFARLAYTHRKEYARWIDEAKRDETRQRRVAQALEMLRQGKTRS